jgi:anion-transporting  ArsA/GET3 family ATPase
MQTGRRGLRLLGQGSLVAWRGVERLLGVSLLSDITEFLLAFEGMYDGFKERAAAVRALLAGPRTVFLLVTTPEREPIEESVFFWQKLVEAELPFGGVIANKLHPAALAADPQQGAGALHDAAVGQLLEAGLEPGLAARIADVFVDHEALAEHDRANVEALVRRLGSEPLLEVRQLDEDVHDVPGLVRLERELFAVPASGRPAS